MFTRLSLLRQLAVVGTGLTILLLSGCAIKPDPTLLNLSVLSGSRQNLDTSDNATPIVVELIEMKQPDAFKQADFFSLYTHPQHVLGSDYVASEKQVFVPKGIQTLKLRLHQGSRYIGVVAAYQDINHVIWQQLITLAPKEKNSVTLTLTQGGVSVIKQSPHVKPAADKQQA